MQCLHSLPFWVVQETLQTQGLDMHGSSLENTQDTNNNGFFKDRNWEM